MGLNRSFNFSWQVFPIHLASKYLKAFLQAGSKRISLDDRRKETRRRFSAFTPVYDLYPRTLLGYLGDLNLKGALIIGKKLTTINKETILEIIFPGELADITVVPVTIPARIAWCKADERTQSYSIGVEFTELTPLHKELIQQILKRYHFSHTLSDADFDSE